MSDHSKPRRWTVVRFGPTAVSSRETGITGADLDDGERVPVREDCITEADVEAAGKTLRNHGMYSYLPYLGAKAASEHVARDLLARIFEGGEQS